MRITNLEIRKLLTIDSHAEQACGMEGTIAPAPSALDIVRTQSLASLVAREIERMILSGTLAAGERLNEQTLATRLGVSRGPVREAVRGLERAGLVVGVRNQGSYVRQVGAEEALEIWDLRAAITGLACARLAERASPRQVSALRALVKRMDAARREGRAPDYFAANVAFHSAILTDGGGPRTLLLCEQMEKELFLFRRRALVEPENMRESNAEHAAIVRAIAARDAAAARATGEAHILAGKRRFRATDIAQAEDSARTAAPPRGARRRRAA